MSVELKASPIIKKHLKTLRLRVNELKEKGVTPQLKVILVGQNPASVIYTENKKKFCEKIGASCEIIKLEETISADDFVKKTAEIAADKNVHGCLIQLPLPRQLSQLNVGELIPSEKDVDGFHSENLIALLKNQHSNTALAPCTPKGIMTLLDFYNIDVAGKNIAIIGRSLIVGKPLALMLTNKNATVTLCHSATANIEKHTQQADIIITAMGQAKFLKRAHLSDKGHQIVIDVGMNKWSNDETCGDVDFQDVAQHVQAITPVPGGVGKMTILSLAQNLLQAAENSLYL